MRRGAARSGGFGMNHSARFGILGMAAGLAASAVQQGTTADAQINAGAIAAYHGAATLPPGAIPGVVARAVIDGLAGATWADQDNDGYVDGYVQNGQYHPGTPPGYDATLRRVLSTVPIGAHVGAAAVAAVGPDIPGDIE